MRTETLWDDAAQRYLTSGWHSNERALSSMVDAMPLPARRILDVGTGAGHAAFAVSPHCEAVVALDSSDGMLRVARQEAQRRALGNLSFVRGDALALPTVGGEFDGVICRVVAHHLADPVLFLHQMRRALRATGWLMLIDTVGIDDIEADALLDKLERLRDPSHVRNLTVQRWHDLTKQAGFTAEACAVVKKPLNLLEWLDRLKVPADRREAVALIIQRANGRIREYLEPVGEGNESTIHLEEMSLLLRRN